LYPEAREGGASTEAQKEGKEGIAKSKEKTTNEGKGSIKNDD
jgi:hypothetical protein